MAKIKKYLLLALTVLTLVFGCFALASCDLFGGTLDANATKGIAYKINEDGKTASVVGSEAGISTETLTNVVISSTYNGLPVTTIGDEAFKSCDSLTSVIIPDSVTTIGDYAFQGCRNLTSVVIGDSLTTIGDYAFQGCNSLTRIYYKGTAAEWTEISIDSLGNSDLTNATRYYYSETEPALNADGTAYDGNYWYYAANGVINIWDEEEFNAREEEEVYSEGLKYTLNADGVSYSVTGIGTCTDTNIIIPSTYKNLPVTTIGDRAFYSRTSLTSVVIPDSVTTIGDRAFWGCEILTSVVIGNSVTTIGDGAFDPCRSLTSVYYKGTAEEWTEISIDSNFYLTEATKYYYSETAPTAEGNYWHYVNGPPTAWE